MTYQPSRELLKKYADVLVKFALNSGAGVKPGEVVACVVPDVAKPFLIELNRSILEAGGQPMLRMIPTGVDRDFYELASDEQLTFFPKKYLKARIDAIDHQIGIIADHDLKELADIDPAKIMKAAESKKLARIWMNEKEEMGKFTWTLALYGTPAMAQEAKMSLEEYWQQIINACFLDKNDPIGEWKKIFKEQERVKKALNELPTKQLHITGDKIDLWISMGEKRMWVGGSGRNIPSFEIFTSPDWRGTNGEIFFNQPLYRYGNIVEGIKLKFKNGRVIEATAKKGEDLLKKMVARPNADKIGEYSLTDSRASRITKFMAETLFDENIGGRFGNTHLAIGMSYKDTYSGDASKVKKSEWKNLGFNDSGEHCDMISTEDRTVTAILKDGSSKVIYKDGQFKV
jgi:aminopeptidase